MDIQFILLIIGAYLLGSVPAAYLAIKWARGVDIRKQGTGNVGAANVLSTGPKWLAVPVALFDIGKGAFCVWVAQLLELGAAQQVTAGLCAIIGHNWPVFLSFRGGRGVFASLGFITILSPLLGLYTLVMPYLFAPFRLVALGVFFAYISVPTLAWFLSEPLDIGIEDKLSITLGFVAMSLIGFSKRLLVPRTALSKSIPLGELLINRLLFDRDIADRKVWVYRSSSSTDTTNPPTDEQGE
ncbi:MAG: glycerol-3-phosphate acyltransferase [Dehalococcoidales bacterium]|nr:MAG: glycerol-3-phosphate acyltransferase [Dehalococcoidales bacterium]